MKTSGSMSVPLYNNSSFLFLGFEPRKQNSGPTIAVRKRLPGDSLINPGTRRWWGIRNVCHTCLLHKSTGRKTSHCLFWLVLQEATCYRSGFWRLRWRLHLQMLIRTFLTHQHYHCSDYSLIFKQIQFHYDLLLWTTPLETILMMNQASVMELF